MTLRERLMQLAQECGPGRIAARELALAAARMALEEAERICSDLDDHSEEALYAESCATAIRALRDSLANV